MAENKRFKDYCNMVAVKINEFNLFEYLKSNSSNLMVRI
jgi:hypothetical protein